MAINGPPSSRGNITTTTANNADNARPSVRKPDRAPPSWRVNRGPAERSRHSNPRPEPGFTGRPPITRRPKRCVMARAVPTVRASYVVEIAAPEDACPDIVARIRPTEQAAASAVEHGFRFSDAFLDAVASLLVEIAREDDDEEGEDGS